MKIKFWIVFISFVLIAIFVTYPLILKMDSSIPGFFSTDEVYGSIWGYWWMKYSHTHKLNQNFSQYIAYPFGTRLDRGLYPALWENTNRFLSILTNEVFTYNLKLFMSFILSGVFMFYLVFMLTNNIPASFFSGLAFTLSPYHFVRVWQHQSMALIELLPLFLITVIKLYETRKLKWLIINSLVTAILIQFNAYYALFMLVALVLFIIVMFYLRLRPNKDVDITNINLTKFLVQITYSGVLAIILSIPLFISWRNAVANNALDPGAWSVIRDFKDLFSQSARPLSYLLPSSEHPVFGDFTRSFLGSFWYGESFTEHTLYLGWTIIILAFIAMKYRKNNQGSLGLKDDKKILLPYFISLLIVAWLFSQPPWWNILGFKIYMPSCFIYKILPMFRAYSRFGIVVMLAISVLAGVGFTFILNNLRSKLKQAVFGVLIFGLLLFEFMIIPIRHNIDLSTVPKVYNWLKKTPEDIVIAEYPLDADAPNELYKFYQTKHRKKMVNGTTPGTPANLTAQTLVKLSGEKTTDRLKEWGIRYVVVHRDGYLNSDLEEDKKELKDIPQNSALKLIKTFPPEDCPDRNIMCVRQTGPIDVYEIK